MNKNEKNRTYYIIRNNEKVTLPKPKIAMNPALLEEAKYWLQNSFRDGNTFEVFLRFHWHGLCQPYIQVVARNKLHSQQFVTVEISPYFQTETGFLKEMENEFEIMGTIKCALNHYFPEQFPYNEGFGSHFRNFVPLNFDEM